MQRSTQYTFARTHETRQTDRRVCEATGLQTHHRVPSGGSARVVGRALPGYFLGLSLQSGEVGEMRVGEVLVGGSGLSRGYVSLPDETARRFKRWGDARVYLTGDIGHWDVEGLTLHGRRDFQVKVSGMRVEMSEIEGAVTRSGLVNSAVCVFTATKELVVHVTLKAEKLDWVCKAALEKSVGTLLPPQVVPRRYCEHSVLPLAAGGKVDRQALEVAVEDPALAEPPFIPLETPAERIVAEAWAAALGSSAESLGLSSNFLWLGGDSLAALRACRQLREALGTANADADHVKLAPPDSDEQFGEAGLLVAAEAPEDALCALSAVLGPLAPCELVARPVLREYAAFLQCQGFQPLSGALGASGASSTVSGTLAELALLTAARAGRESVVRCLLAAGTPVDGAGSFTPLHAAASSGAIGCLRCLLEARGNLRARTSAWSTPAHLAAARGDAASLHVLLAKHGPEGIATWARDADGQTVLHLAARSGDVPTVQEVLKRVATLKASHGGLGAQDRWSRTALQWAIANGNSSAAVALMQAGSRTSGIPKEVLQEFTAASEKVVQPSANRKILQARERIHALVMALPSSGSVVEESEEEEMMFALTALRDYCCGAREHRVMAVEAGAVPRLLSLLSNRVPPNALSQAAQTLRNLTVDRSGADVVRTAGGIDILAEIATMPPECAAAWRAAAAIAHLTMWRENWEAIKLTGAMPSILKLSRMTRRLPFPQEFLVFVGNSTSHTEEGSTSREEQLAFTEDVSGQRRET